MVSSFMKYIQLLYWTKVVFAYHIGEERFFKLNKKGFPSVLTEPLLVDCGVPMCTGDLAPIYCFGKIISNSWQLGLQDSCPGSKLKFKPHIVMENYNKLKYPINRLEFELFCRSNFENVSYLEKVALKDWKIDAAFLTKLSDLKHIKLATELHLKWAELARTFTKDVHNNSGLYPVVPVKNPFIVPGGQFQIYFYWDSYWILKGLLISGMLQTTQGIIENFANIIMANGFIPNSGNIQLSRRTQPPLFIHMVQDYYNYTKDISSLRRWVPAMEREMHFWLANRTVTIGSKDYSRNLFLFKVETTCPRPENFMVDYQIGLNSTDPESTWKAIASACESGWDFSTRWFDHHGEKRFSKSSIRTHTIVPVGLNIFMALNMRYISDFHSLLGNENASTIYENYYKQVVDGVKDVMWNETEGCWFDYDLQLEKHRTEFYPTNTYPLLLQEMRQFAERVNDYLEKKDVYKYPGGIPSTLPVPSQEQWDFPNVWAPNQHLFIKSLLASGHFNLLERAKQEAQKFINVVYNGLLAPEPGARRGIWEKYDARSSEGRAGGGGEYSVQEGFGWTNGVVLDLIWIFRDSAEDDHFQLEFSFFTGDGMHAAFIIGFVSVMIFIAIWFTLSGVTYGRAVFLMNTVATPVDIDSSRPLLDDSEE